MAIKIEFDSSHNVIPPTLVLTTRSGNRLGGLLYHNLVVKQAIRHSMEMSFSINKNDYTEKNRNADLWSLITDFKLVWCKEWNCYFEITVSTNEESTTDKEITAVSLGDSELSQINLYDIQINTEDDIARDDYEPTVLYNVNNPNASLLHRIMEKVPHYTIKYVDGAIKDIQRTFTFDNKSLYDAFQEIAEEMECVFDIICSHGTNGIERNIYVRDLDNYGNDTNILLSTDALADNINYSVDTGAVKNCFRLEAGDDLMTATVRNCNPNGSGYIWYISDGLKSDMSNELVEKLESYNQFYDYYYNDYNPFNPTTTGLLPVDAAKVSSRIPSYAVLRSRYNALIDKYSEYTSDYQKIDTPMVGYPSIMEAYYNTVDFYYYLNDSLMPNVQMSDTNAQAEANKLTFQSLKNTAVQNLSATTSVATVNSAIGAMAKAIVDTRYQIKVLDDECSFTYSEQNPTWNGKIKVTNYSDEEDTATVTLRTIIISGDYAKFIQQKLDTVLANTRTDTIADITDLFKLAESPFKAELKRYSLQRLKAFHDACQGCIDILIQQGIAAESNTQSSMYQQIYLPYYNKLGFIQAEMDVRQSELDLVSGKFDSEGGLLEYGMQTVLEKERDRIQENLDFQAYLGEDLWQEFVAYRREDTYSNTNYVSDGLGNDELFSRAMEFIETAKYEIEKSATKQHTINARLKNLLVMKEFASIVDCFEVGNWLRLKVDGKVFKLRLVDYQIDFESLESIDITFSDIVVEGTEGTAKDILNHAASMATSYNTVSRQARKGDKGSKMLDNWVDDGLALTTTKIIDTADNQEVSWDKHGLVCREYNDLTDSYSDTQVKLINKGIYITDNNWRTAKAGIGNFTFFNPAANNSEGEYQEAYGVIADTLVGNLILGKSVGIYNTKNSITMDEDGFVLTTDGTGSDDPQSVFTIRRKTVNNGVKSFKDMFYIDSNGFVTINGGVRVDIDGKNGNSTMIEMVDGKITTHITDELDDGGLIQSSISQTANSIEAKVANKLYGTNGKTIDEAAVLTATSDSIVGKVSKNETDISNRYTKSETNSQISQTADQIKSTVSSAVSKYDETGYTISLYGYGSPTASSPSAASNTNALYLDQETGYVYKSNGSSWSRHKDSENNYVTLPLITSNLQSQVTQNAGSISAVVTNLNNNYYKKSELQITENGVTSSVTDYLSGTFIQQRANDIQIAWNNISKYISFANAALNIYDNGTTQNDSTLLMRLNSTGLNLYESNGNSGNRYTMRLNRTGANYYNEGVYLGKIGTNKFAGNDTIRGLTFNLDPVASGETARYMSWGYATSGSSSYTPKFIYYTNDFTYNGDNCKKGFYFSDDARFNYETYFNNTTTFSGSAIFYNGVNVSNAIHFGSSNESYIGYSSSNNLNIVNNTTAGAINIAPENITKMTLARSAIDMYADTDFHNYTISNATIASTSDARLKTNIENTKVNALKTINSIEMKEYDWKSNGEHVELGIIAQQLREISPNLIYENPKNGQLAIKIDRLIPYLVKAIQELSLN